MLCSIAALRTPAPLYAKLKTLRLTSHEQSLLCNTLTYVTRVLLYCAVQYCSIFYCNVVTRAVFLGSKIWHNILLPVVRCHNRQFYRPESIFSAVYYCERNNMDVICNTILRYLYSYIINKCLKMNEKTNENFGCIPLIVDLRKFPSRHFACIFCLCIRQNLLLITVLPGINQERCPNPRLHSFLAR